MQLESELLFQCIYNQQGKAYKKKVVVHLHNILQGMVLVQLMLEDSISRIRTELMLKNWLDLLKQYTYPQELQLVLMLQVDNSILQQQLVKK